MNVIIDRFEGEYAVCEKDDKNMINIEKNKVPLFAKEGDVLLVTGNKIIIDEVATMNRKKSIEEMTKNLWA